MSIQTAQNKIKRIQREIERLRKKLTNESTKEAKKSDQISKEADRLAKTKSSSTAKSKQRKIQRLEKDIVRIQKKKANLTKKISRKTSDLHKAQNDLYKEQDKEQKKFQKELEKKEKESKRQISSLINQLDQSQPNSIKDSKKSTTSYDAFISHASEDKENIVRPLADKLKKVKFDIWYDEFELKVGDSLRRKIDAGLANSKFGIVILSPDFFAKNWPQYELDGLVQKEMTGGKVILPIWHKVTKNEVMKYSPSLADKVALNTTNFTIEEIVEELTPILE